MLSNILALSHFRVQGLHLIPLVGHRDNSALSEHLGIHRTGHCLIANNIN